MHACHEQGMHSGRKKEKKKYRCLFYHDKATDRPKIVF